jgi:hypothetical protein
VFGLVPMFGLFLMMALMLLELQLSAIQPSNKNVRQLQPYIYLDIAG